MDIQKGSRGRGLGILIIAFILLGGLFAFPLEAGSPWRISSVPAPGADGLTNNTVFVYGHYVIVAPYAPSTMPTDPSSVDSLDNDRVYLIDVTAPAGTPRIQRLSSASG